ncbi:sperm associated antigen 6-like, partial [Planoprotostelium fungivorum]
MSLNSSKAVVKAFDDYQKARTAFVQSVVELAQNPKNIPSLQEQGVMAQLRPLLLDSVPSIQHNAAQALSKLASHSAELASAVVQGDILPQLVYSLAEQNKFYKKAAAGILRAVSKHSPPLAQSVVDCGAIDALATCLEEFDPGVKEQAAWALGYIARHNAELSQAVVDTGAVPLLVLCVQEPELAVKRIAASALSDISKHTPELAQSVVDAGSITYLAPLIKSNDAALKRQVCSCLGQIAKHSVELAELVVEGGIFPTILDRLRDPDQLVRKNAAILIREISKHTPELASLVVNSGGIAAVVDYIHENRGANALASIMTIGYVSAFSETMAKAVIDAKGITPLLDSLKPDQEDHIRSASAWALGQVGRHSSEHAEAVANGNALLRLVECFSADSSEDLRTKSKRALKSIIEKCTNLAALEPLIDSPGGVQEYVIYQFAKILPNDTKARRDFATNGSLQKLQVISTEPGSKLKDYIQTINNVYPEEIVQYYSPGYSKTLLAKIEDYPNDSVRDTHKEGESIPLPNDILYDPHTGLHRYPFLSSQLIAYINLDSIELMAAGMWIVVNFFKFYRHNSLMGIAYVKLFHYTKDLKYRDAALLLADHLVEMNLNRESFLFSGPEDARLWKIETRGADIKKRPAHTARCSSSAMCLIFWSYLRDLSPHHDEIYLQIVKSLFHHFRGDDRWKVSEGDDYFRAVDQGLMQLALLRMLKMYKRGDDAVTSLNETSIEKEIERTRRDVRENFHEKDDCITYINKRGHPVAWHSIWVISSVLLSDSSVDHMDRISAFQRQFLDGSGLIVGIKGKLEDVHFSNDNFLLLMVAKCAEIRGLPFHVSLDSLWNKFKDHSHWIKIHPQTEAVFALTFDPTDFTQPTAAKLIDQTLSEERGRQVLESKLLLLGAGEAGKSTIQRQIRIQYGEGFTERERLAYKSVVHNNLVSSVKMLIHSAQENGLTISAKEAAEAFDQIDATSFDQKGADLMSQLWADPQIQAAYHLPIVVDSVRYWFEHASRIAAPDYIPDDSDLFRMRAKSVGVNETQFIVEGSSFRLIDVGGQRSERSKWIHCFENVTLVLFCVAINEYDLPVENGQCSYKLQESLKLFTDICNSQWFNSTSVVLLFNKEDLFKEKVEKVDLKVCFPEYTGGLNYNKAMHFLQNKFTGRNQNTNKSVHIYPLVATDKESIHSLFNAVREITKKVEG